MSDKLLFSKVRVVASPRRANATDAGIDFFVPLGFERVVLAPHQDVLIPSGIKVKVPYGWALVGANKSGTATKKRLQFGAHVIDEAYQGEVHIHVYNTGTKDVEINPGDKLIQFILLEVGLHEPTEVLLEDLYTEKSTRGEGGFGSTGTTA